MKTGIEAIREINNKWYNELKSDTNLELVMYEPFTNDYWAEKYKIVLCNLEPAARFENRDLLDLCCFNHWLEEKNPTIKRSALFLYCLYNTLNGIVVDNDQLKKAKNDNGLLMETVKKVTYMNLLRDVGERRFNNKYFWDFFSDNVNVENTINFINALSPDVFVVTSEGKDLIEKLFHKKFDEDHFLVENNILFVAIAHPSSSSFSRDEYILYWINKINEKIKEKK